MFRCDATPETTTIYLLHMFRSDGTVNTTTVIFTHVPLRCNVLYNLQFVKKPLYSKSFVVCQIINAYGFNASLV